MAGASQPSVPPTKAIRDFIVWLTVAGAVVLLLVLARNFRHGADLERDDALTVRGRPWRSE